MYFYTILIFITTSARTELSLSQQNQIQPSHPVYLIRHRQGVEVSLYPVLTSALDLGGWSTPRPGGSAPRKELLYPLHKRQGGSQGQSVRVWRRVKSLSPTGVRAPDRPVRTESPYRLRCPGLCSCYIYLNINHVLMAPTWSLRFRCSNLINHEYWSGSKTESAFLALFQASASV